MSRQTIDGDGGKLAGASLLAAALATVTQPVWVLDRDGLIRVANPAAAATLGYPDAGELLGRNGHDTVHVDPLDAEPHASSDCPLLRPRTTGETVTSELDRFVRRDGSTLPVSYVSAPLELPDGCGTVLAFTDTEALRHAEAALTERETRLTEQEDTLRRLATLVARETAADPVFQAVAAEAAGLLRCDAAAVVRFEKDGMVTSMGGHHTRRLPRTRLKLDPDFVVAGVRRTGRAARFDTDDPTAPDMPEPVRAEGVRSAVAGPIVVGGELWGAMVVGSLHGALPSGTERLLADFTDLLATAVSNAQARDDLQRLADEQAALRRVATLVAQEAPQADVFAAIAEEVRRVLGTEEVRMVRYEGEFAVVVGSSVLYHDAMYVGSRHPLEGDNVTMQVYRTERPARMEDYTRATGKIADTVRLTGIRSAVGTPIAVDGRLWGVIVAATSRDEPLPRDTEVRLGKFTELMATAIANTESRARADQLTDEQAALRRLATLVAQEAPLEAVFAKVAEEVARTLGDVDSALWRDDRDGTVIAVAVQGPSVAPGVRVGTRLTLDGDSVIARVLHEGRPHRIDDYSQLAGSVAERARELGMRSAVGCPIVVGSRPWGAMTVATYDAEPFAPETETRVAQFSELVATAIAHAESRAEVERLAREQAALRRVATLVAAGVQPADLFAAVSQEVAQLFGTELASVGRFDPDGPSTVVVGLAGDTDEVAIGARIGLEEGLSVTAVYRTGHAARVDRADWSGAAAPVAAMARRLGTVSTVSSPIVVEGHLWGSVTVMDRGALPLDTEDRLANFTQLVGTAIANSESGARVRRLADEQAALRRVATLVAEAVPPSAVFGAVASEAGALFGADFSGMLRYEDATTVSTVATWAATGDHPEVPERWPIEAGDPMTLLADAGAPTRVEDWGSIPGEIARVLREGLGVSCSVGCRIMVEGRAWGAIAVHWKARPAAVDNEARLGQFADLVATAIANAEARGEVERLADEQAALRRVATLVAEGASASAVLDAVAAETERALGADAAMLLRYEPDEELTLVARRVPNPGALPPGMRISHKGHNVSSMVRRSGRPARIADYRLARGQVADIVRATEWKAAVGAPVVLDGRLWGVIVASWAGDRSPPDDAEERMAEFAQLLDTAIANADGREQLMASRARLLTAGDEARRRVVRDLHDGAQQRLVHATINLKLAEQALQASDDETARLVGEALTHVELGNEELRELAHGILPASLTNGGLRAGLDAVVARLDVLVRLDVPPERFAAEIEASAYFVVAEALTNVVKHAHAKHAEVRVSVEDGMLHVDVRDDGTGGADPGGHGLVGIADRVTALGGRLAVGDATGGGTLVAVSMPLSEA